MPTPWPHCLSPRPALYHAGGLPLAYGTSSGKKEFRGTIWPSQNCRETQLWLFPLRFQGNLRGSTTWNLILSKCLLGKACVTASTQILTNYIPTWRAPIAVSTSNFVLLQNQMVQLDQGTWQRSGLPDLGPQIRSFASLKDWSDYAKVEEWSHSHTHCSVGPRPIWPKGQARPPGSCVT